MYGSVRITGVAIVLLAAFAIGIWSAAFAADHRGTLTVSFLDVGGGSAAFITAPSGRTALVDGGPDTSVLRKLSSELPWWQHSLDVVISSSPAAGSSVGLVDVLSRYHIGTIVRSPVSGSDQYSRALASAIDAARGKGADVATGKRGQIIDMGSGSYIEVLSPDRDVSGVTASDGCLVVRVVYGTTSFLLPCNASIGVQNYLAYLDGASLHSDVLELPGVGAKAPSELFVGYASPSFAVISRDCRDAPAQVALDMLARFGTQIADTCASGTVTFVSDGNSIVKK